MSVDEMSKRIDRYALSVMYALDVKAIISLTDDPAYNQELIGELRKKITAKLLTVMSNGDSTKLCYAENLNNVKTTVELTLEEVYNQQVVETTIEDIQEWFDKYDYLLSDFDLMYHLEKAFILCLGKWYIDQCYRNIILEQPSRTLVFEFYEDFFNDEEKTYIKLVNINVDINAQHFIQKLTDGDYSIKRNDLEDNNEEVEKLIERFVKDYSDYHWLAIDDDFDWAEGIFTNCFCFGNYAIEAEYHTNDDEIFIAIVDRER